MQRLIFLGLLSVILVLASCAKPTEKTVIQTKIIKQNIQIQAKPRPVTLRDIKFYTVTADNYEDFVKEFEKNNSGQLVFIAISVGDYENLSLNLADLRRYLNQQSEIIVFYESAISN